MKSIPFILTCVCLSILAVSPGSGIQIEDDDASLDISLVDVHVPTQTVAVTRVIVSHEDAIIHSDLLSTIIPTERLPIRKVYTSNEDAAFVVTQITYPWELVSPGVNQSPQFQALADQQVETDRTLNLQLHAIDADGDQLTFSTADLPAGAHLSGSTFTWTPTEDQMGSHTLNFTVSDGRGETDSQTVQIEVEGRSEVPSLLGDIDGDKEVTSGDAILALRYAAGLEDPTEERKIAADVDRDGSLTAGDAILILRYAAGLMDSFSKPVVTPVSPVVVAVDEIFIPTHDGVRHLTLTFQSPIAMSGGDLSLWCDIPLAGTVSLEGLSYKGQSVINTDTQGHIRVSFVDLDGPDPNRALRLNVQLEEVGEDRVASITLQGKLYDRQGQLRGEILTTRTIQSQLPAAYMLHQNYPNPINPSTTIRYALPEEGRVSVSIFNVFGQQVRSLVDDWQQAGTYAIHWDGKDGTGREVGSGIYLCRMESGAFTRVNKMVLLK